MQIEERVVDDVTILDLKGKMTLGEGDELLKDKIASLVSQGKKKILLNLEAVPRLQGQARRAGPGAGRAARAGRNDRDLRLVRTRDHGAVQAHAGAAGSVPLVLPATEGPRGLRPLISVAARRGGSNAVR